MAQKRKTYGGAALALFALIFIGLIMLSNYALRGLRVDLTENNQYTLAEGTLNIVKNIDEPINLYFYFSGKAGEKAPYLKIYATRVRELLEELASRSRGRIRLQVIDPEPFSEDEDRASELGLSPVPIGAGGDTMYFGLAGTNSTDGKATIQVFQPDKEEFLEYDIAKLIVQLSHPDKPTLGLLSTLPMSGGFNQQTGQQTPGWFILTQLRQLFEIETLSTSAERISDDIDVLMLVHPKNLSDRTLFAVEQFIMRGGHALIFVDPRAEADSPSPTGGQQDAYAAMLAPRHSSLEKLFKAWGVQFDTGQIVSDMQLALEVQSPSGMPVRHLGYLGPREDNLSNDDVVTGGIGQINLATPGSFSLTDKSQLTLEPLISTGAESGTIAAERFMMLSDPSSLRNDFKPAGGSRVLAGRLTGTITTAFPQGAPAASTDDGDDEAPAPAADSTSALQTSQQSVNVILVADTDLLSDMMWVRRQSFFGQTMAQAFASNGDFVMNAVDNLGGSSDLISIRGRASFVRPFTRVNEIKLQAEERFLAKEQELEQQLRSTEEKLGELQSGRSDAASAFIMSPEQEEELRRFQDEKLRVRKELREVRHGMDREIDRLGRNLRIINIVLMPLLLTGAALGIVLWRRRRRRQREARS